MTFQAHPKVTEKLKGLIKEWSVSFKDDPQLRYVIYFQCLFTRLVCYSSPILNQIYSSCYVSKNLYM